MISMERGAFIRRMMVTVTGVVAVVLACALPSRAATEWNVGLSGGSHGIDGFHLSVGDYYDVPEREVVVIHDRGIDDEELPVVFFLAKRAHVSPEAIVKLRLRGMNWMDITLHFGLSPEIYYVPVREGHHPHGNAYGYYKNHPKHTWKKIRLQDRDIVNQVNLKFISEHHGYDADKVMRYRSEGRSFVRIDDDVRQERHGKPSFDGRKDKAPKVKYDSDRKEMKHQDKREWKEMKKQDKGHGNGKDKKWDK